MKESPVFPGFDTVKNSNEFDFQADFTQFLEEAKKFANEKKLHPVVEQESGRKKVGTNQEKKGTKKSWKTALFSFWRSSSDKKAKQHPKEYPKRRGHVSGPIYGVGGAATVIGGGHWHRLAASGPLTSLFHQKKRKGVDDGIPYVSLERLNEPQYDAKTYGPVYLVS